MSAHLRAVPTDVAEPPPGESVAEVRRRFDALRAAYAVHGAPGLAARLDSLARLERAVMDHRAAIEAAISADFGNRSTVETALSEVATFRANIRYARKHLAGWMKPARRRVPLTYQPASAWVQYQPLGVIGIISPWNYPLLLAAAPLTDALAAGNRAIVKPSEYTPRFASLFQEIIGRAFDPAEVTVVTGGPEVAEAVTRLPVDHLMFTGSTRTGRKVMMAAAENLVPVTLELGGKSPTIVCEDYPVIRAAKDIVGGKFFNAGQTCVAPDYVLAPPTMVNTLAEAILAEARRRWPTIAANPDYTAINNDGQYRRLRAAVEEARAAGARVMAHEDAGAEAARKIGPTVVIDPPEESLLMREEIFGPVLPIRTSDSVDAAIAYVNAHDRPLALYCLTNDPTLRARVLDRTLSGGVTLNGTLLHSGIDALPFGGVGPSGTGSYHGFDGFARFSHARGVVKIGRLNPLDMVAPPYGRKARFAIRLAVGRPAVGK